MTTTFTVDPSSLPILASGTFGTKKDPPHQRKLPMERAICDAIGAALGPGAGRTPERHGLSFLQTAG